MNVILNYFIEANLGLILFYGLYKFLFKDETSFAFNRTYLLGSIALSLLFPLLTIGDTTILPSMRAVIPSGYLPDSLPTEINKTSPLPENQPTFSLWSLIIWVYLGVAFSMLIRFSVQLFKVVKRIYSHHFVQLNGSNGKIVETDAPHPTFSFFNYIFIGSLHDLNAEEKSQVIAHELVHVRQMHTIDILVIEILRIVFWFNPLLGMYRQSLIMVHEFQADAHSVITGDTKKYCNLLARVALLSADFKLANHFTNSLTLKRIKMLNAMKKKLSIWKLAILLPVIAGFFFAVACQDQVMNEVTEVARNSTMSVQYPKEVQARLDELKTEDPNANWVVVEFNDEGKAKIEALTKEHGMNFKMSSLKVKDDDFEKTGVLKEYWIINFDENASKVADLSQDADEVFMVVEQTATYPGGMEKFYTDVITPNMKYPAQARQMGIEGKVFVQMIVEKDGTLGNFQVLKGIGAGCDEEAMRILSLSKPWNPGQQRGQIVRQKIVLPIFFKLTAGSSYKEPSRVQEITAVPISIPESSQKDGNAFIKVEQSATYPGGMEKFYNFFNENFTYPEQARKMGIEGKVFVQFVVKPDGSLTNFQILKGIGGGCDEEALRVVALSNHWIPGKQDGKNVMQRMVIPVQFKL